MKSVLALAMVGSAAAFSPMMSAGSAAAAPFLRTQGASAKIYADNKAPIITVFDHRGCPRSGKEYKGQKSLGQDDDMMVKVTFNRIKVTDEDAQKLLQESIGPLK
eukprot:CAMPEP_0184310942 /NCGR_PEP_ID=MMETSP1049-20130417/36660_1 /TAXON_ID=77928 /ORGANISM="Proteomonas sulcata, Strain CCMP704" /LENGTH=104 /DNA_ID=CAMNT_0026625801 /DNA_START=9 /DNA_END=323 /DNA_ORIENTATION=+